MNKINKVNIAIEIDKLKKNNIPNCLTGIYPTYISKAKNSIVWDVEGRRYIDFYGGIAVLNVGHSHPLVLKSVTEQLNKFQHTCFAIAPYQNYLLLAKELNRLVPGDFKKKTFFINSGAEAVENAIKIARYTSNREAVISFKGGFHGRTQLAINLTGKVDPYKQKMYSPNHGIYHLPFPAKQLDVTSNDSLKHLESLFKSTVSPKNVAAILIELVQGEGGFYQAPIDFVFELRKICDQHDIKLIVDEVQTGFGRTGKFFAIDHYIKNGKQLEADIVIFAKSMAAGFPLSGVTGRAELLDAIHPGGIGSTYGGNPVSVAAALAVIEIIKSEDLLDKANYLGDKLVKSLNKLKNKQPLISEVRQLGSMIAIEFYDKKNNIFPIDFTKKIVEKAFDEGLLLVTCGYNGNAIRFLYPLTIEEHVMDEAIDIISKVIV